MELTELTISQAYQGLKEKRFSASELLLAYLSQIDSVEPKVKAFITLAREEALNQAEEIDLKIQKGEVIGLLTGLPVAVKDVIVTKGIKTTAASQMLANYLPPFDATVVRKLKQVGAIILGKTNCDEFAMGSSTENSALFPTHNPWDLSRVPGGSSGGSAAAVAAQECLFSIGSDTGGSIRQPAAFCGVVGLKPTYGRVSRYGLIAMASSLDQIGPLARTVEDVQLILKTIQGEDKLDATSQNIDQLEESEIKNTSPPLKNLKIGIPREYFSHGLEPGVAVVIKSALGKLEELGGRVVEVSLPHAPYALACYYIIMPAEVSANLARFDGIRYGASVMTQGLTDNKISLADVYSQSRGRFFGSEVRRRIILGTYTLSAGYYEAYYLKAQQVRTLVRQDFEKVFQDVDILASPVSPTPAFKLGEKLDDPLQMYLSDIYTVAVNVAGLPALSLPAGFVKAEDKYLPVGLQLIGKWWTEATLCQVGQIYQETTSWHRKRPNLKDN